MLIGVRDISASGVPSPSWVNTHLQYTHGNGAAVALSNQTTSNNPVFAVQDVPPTSSNGMPRSPNPTSTSALGETGYVVANSKQLEVDYQKKDGTNVESHYTGTGGVQLSSIFTRAAFALRLGDFNLLISSQITDKSRIMFIRDPVAMAQTAAPFLTFDHDPYAVIKPVRSGTSTGSSTATRRRPTTRYSQNADTQQVAVGSNLPGSYNYVRNSVKVVIDAYSGKMTFYDTDPNDPILKAYSAAFPNMFTPISKMPAALQAHLRYPPDIFSIQSAIYGRYHLTNSGQFYAASNAWQLSPTAGAGPQSQALLAQNTYNNQGQLVSTTPARMSPQYQVYSLPGTQPDQQLFTVSDAFVPASQTNLSGNNQNFNLTAWMVGLADPGHYGQLNLYETPQGTAGPANADAEISANKTVSSDITLLDQHGSEVLLGETLMVPIANSMVYLRPLYASPTTNPQPQLQYVVGVLGKTVQIDTSLSAVLSDLLQTTVSLPSESGVSSTGTVPLAVAGLLQQAQTDYTNALAALKAGNLGQFQTDIDMMQQADHAGAAGDRGARCPHRRRPPRRRCRRSRGRRARRSRVPRRRRPRPRARRPRPPPPPRCRRAPSRKNSAPRPRRRWSRRRRRPEPARPLSGAERLRPAARPGPLRFRLRAGPVRSHDGRRGRGKEALPWDCSTRSRRRRRRRRRWPRTRRPRARPR